MILKKIVNCNEIKEEIRKYQQINENKHGTFQTLWDVAKVHRCTAWGKCGGDGVWWFYVDASIFPVK